MFNKKKDSHNTVVNIFMNKPLIYTIQKAVNVHIPIYLDNTKLRVKKMLDFLEKKEGNFDNMNAKPVKF